ncbi:MAG TPA: uroporphyrinogen-III synthase [Candidatus Dormibacteraeota bacterium]|jgi:uroporphyrinogen-III synthase|nr:uroporphyrinogen-III synthase [Candidatus Dormibacteraeota bacterium]
MADRIQLRKDQKTIAITRPVGKGKDTFQFVKSLGWKPFIFHTVELKPLDSWAIRDQLQSCLEQGPIDWIVFMSSSGVRLVFESFPSNPHSRGPLRKTSFLAVGPRTKDALGWHGVTQASVPKKYSSVGVGDFFSHSDPGLRIVLVRSSSADDSLSKSLAARGAKVTTVNVYESLLPKDPGSAFRFLEGLRLDRFSAVLFTSAISASNFFKIAQTETEDVDVAILMRRVLVGAVGPVTAAELTRRGIVPLVPEEYLIENAIRTLIACLAGDEG